MRSTIGLIFAATMTLTAHQAVAYNCNGLPAYVMGTTYATGAIVKNANGAYQCTVGGWCSLNSDAYSPGTGWAASNAWNSLGACDTVASSAPASSKPASSSSIASSIISSSKASSLISSSKASSSLLSSSVGSSIKSSSSIASSVGVGCTSPAYVAGTAYTTNQKVANIGHEYSCKVPGWCSSPADWAYAPGTGSAWKDAWTDVGICTGGGSSSVASSAISSSSKPASSSSSVAVSSSKPASSSSSAATSSTSGNCAIEAVSGGFSMCKSTLDAAEASKTSSTVFAQVKASIQTRDNSIVDAIIPGASSNPDNVKRVESIVSESSWNYMFSLANTAYNYTRFLRAVGKFKGFCATYTDGRNSDAICRKSLATMFAHFTQETGAHAPNWPEEEWRQGLYFVREYQCTETGPGCGYNSECGASGWQTEKWPCGKQANGEFVKYYGRGAKQLSYHYNYGPFSEAMFGDVKVLLNNPDLVAESWLNVASAVFFFVYPQSPKPSMLHVVDGTWVPNAADQAAGIKPGFGATIHIINGGLECGSGAENIKAQNRINYYQKFSAHMNSSTAGENLGCATMQPFSSTGAGSILTYWEKDWGYKADTPGNASFECKLVNYQTAFNALVTGDYQKCVMKNFDVKVIK